MDQQEGARDAYQRGYHPRDDRRFHDTPDYHPRLGPYAPYHDALRAAYRHDYDRSFNR